jgi:hypothetical protein
MTNLHKELLAEIRHAIVNMSAEIKLCAKGKRTETQTLIIIVREITRAEKCLKMLQKNGL